MDSADNLNEDILWGFIEIAIRTGLNCQPILKEPKLKRNLECRRRRK